MPLLWFSELIVDAELLMALVDIVTKWMSCILNISDACSQSTFVFFFCGYYT